ncbi:MAG: hypothetical protein L3J65_11265 [Robiginitomaculum sp.]|nr:hypothetical protein [Robiginitomaculum sp.]
MNFTCPTLLWLRRSRRNTLIGVIAWGILFTLHDYLSARHLISEFWNGILTVILILTALMLLASFCSAGNPGQQSPTQDEHHE